MTKQCLDCTHWVTCIWRRAIDDFGDSVPLSWDKAESFRIWRGSFAEICDYSQFKENPDKHRGMEYL